MTGAVTAEEREIFSEAYHFFEKYNDPPANQEDFAADWWQECAKDVGSLDNHWKDHPLMRELLLAIYAYLDDKAKEKTKEMAEFVFQES